MITPFSSLFRSLRFRINQSIFATSSKLGKMETSYFKYGLFDWSLSLYPSGRADSQLGKDRMRMSPRSMLSLLTLLHKVFDSCMKFTALNFAQGFPSFYLII